MPFKYSSGSGVMEPLCLPNSSTDVACLAHDQNNYLQVAFCRLDTLRTHLEGDSTGLEFVDKLHQILESLNSMNRKVLHEFRDSRVTSIEERVDPDEVIKKTVELAGCINAKGVRIELRLGASDAVQPIPEIHLQQVVFNLLKNALEAAPAKGGEVIVESAVRPYRGRDSARDGSRVLRITLTDNGSGIPDGIRPHLFECGSSSKPEGHGLGLHHAKRILGLYGGSIDLYSNHALGTRAIVVWPFE